MELTNQSARLLKQEFGKTNEEIVDNAYKHAAGCAGICYASRKIYEHADEAKNFAESEFEKYRIVQDRLFKSDFDNSIGGLFDEIKD